MKKVLKTNMLMVLMMSVLLMATTLSWAREAAPQPTKSSGTIGGYLGYFMIAGSSGNDTGKLHYGLCASFDMSDSISLIGRVNTYSVGDSSVSISHTFYNVGLSTSGFGAGVCFTDLGGLTGTGFFLEYAAHDPGFYYSLRYDFVSIAEVAVGGFSINFGYTFGL